MIREHLQSIKRSEYQRYRFKADNYIGRELWDKATDALCQARELLSTVDDKSSGDEVDLLLLEGTIYFKQGNLEESYRIFQDASKVSKERDSWIGAHLNL